MALLSLDRHDVLETIRQSNSLYEAFLRAAKLPAVGEYRTATNADRIRAMTDEELAEWVWGAETAGRAYGPRGKKAWLDWLREEENE